MTKEQEKAIEILRRMIKSYIKADECGLSNNDFKYEIKAMETVLNMLKEKDKKIEYYKKQKDYDMQFRHELLEQIRCLNLDKDHNSAEIEQKNTELAEKSAEIEKKDRIIDLMAEFIEKVTVDLKIAFGENMLWNRNEIKQYFEREAKSDK